MILIVYHVRFIYFNLNNAAKIDFKSFKIFSTLIHDCVLNKIFLPLIPRNNYCFWNTCQKFNAI